MNANDLKSYLSNEAIDGSNEVVIIDHEGIKRQISKIEVVRPNIDIVPPAQPSPNKVRLGY